VAPPHRAWCVGGASIGGGSRVHVPAADAGVLGCIDGAAVHSRLLEHAGDCSEVSRAILHVTARHVGRRAGVVISRAATGGRLERRGVRGRGARAGLGAVEGVPESPGAVKEPRGYSSSLSIG